MPKQIKFVFSTLLSVLAIMLIVSVTSNTATMETKEKSSNEKKEEKLDEQDKAKEKIRKQYMDRKNDANIDVIKKGQNGYTISMKPAQTNNKLVKPKSMKVYKKEKGKLIDITNKGEVEPYSDGKFIRWSYKNDSGKDVAPSLKKHIGKNVIFDVTFDEAVKPNTTTKEGQFVKKQISDLEQRIKKDKVNNDKKTLKKHKNLLKDNKEWLSKIENEKKKTHRYMHEIRY